MANGRYSRKRTRNSRKWTAPKNIKRRTSARAQSKQILSLSRRVNSLTATSVEKIRTSWLRVQNPFEPTASFTGPNIYMCPIPYNCCDPDSTLDPSGSQRGWSDNNMQVSQPVYKKSWIFGISSEAQNAGLIKHKGGRIKYQFENSEPSMTKLGVFLIRPKKAFADQLTVDRNLKGGAGDDAGKNGSLVNGLDFVVHDNQAVGASSGNTTYFGAEMNSKYWDTLYHREITLGHPDASGFTNTVNPANTRPANNALTACGTIRVPAGGVIKNLANSSQDGVGMNASEMGFLDSRNENNCYLVIINNGITADGEDIKLSFQCVDYYDAYV